jgi:phytoene/squalene synthetase
MTRPQLKATVIASREHANQSEHEHAAALATQAQLFDTERRHFRDTITAIRSQLEKDPQKDSQ